MAAKLDIIAFINDGRADPGHSWVRANWGGWDFVFHGTDKPDGYPYRYTPREAADICGKRLMIHNIGGRFLPMTIDQFTLTAGLAQNNPDDADLQAHADWPELIRTASKFVSQGYELICYVGGEQTSDVLPHETPSQWAKRKEEALAPILRITPHIARLDFDATNGQVYLPDDPYWRVVGGKKGGMARLIEKVQKMGIQVGVEMTALKSATWLHDCTTSIRDSNLAFRESNGWIGRDVHGELQEFMPCLEMASKPISILRGSANQPNIQKWIDIRFANEKGYTGAIYVSHFPDPEE